MKTHRGIWNFCVVVRTKKQVRIAPIQFAAFPNAKAPGVKRNFWRQFYLRMRRVIFQAMPFTSNGCSLIYQKCWELMV